MTSPSDLHMSISFDEMEALVTPYLPLLRPCFLEPWALWRQQFTTNAAFVTPFSKKSRASVINDHIWDAVKRQFINVEGARWSEDSGLRLLYIRDRIMIRFKKLDKRLRSRNVRTRQQHELQQQFPIDGLLPIPNLVMGYVVDTLETEIATLAVTYSINNSVKWHMPVSVEDVTVELLPFDVSIEEPQRQRRVTPKKVDRDAKRRTGNE